MNPSSGSERGGAERASAALSRSAFLRLLGTGALGLPAAAAAESPAPATRDPLRPDLSIGVLTDCQYADVDPHPVMTQRLYRQSPQKLANAVSHLNAMDDLDFVVHLGDAVDRNAESFRVVMPLFRSSSVPLCHVAGNHDFDVADAVKPRVHELLGMPGKWYAREFGKWRLLFLDGNELSLFAHPAGSPELETARSFKAAATRELADYSGGLGAEQRAWLDGQLKECKAAGQRAVLLCHYPLLPVDAHTLWDNAETDAVLAAHPGVVAAWFNGHNHAGNYAERDGVHYLNFKGMLDTPETAYARADVYPERIEITGFGREGTRTLRLPAGA